MKMTYERPVMHAELFQADNFCLSACQYDPHLNATVTTSRDWQWFSPRDGWTVEKTVIANTTLENAGFDLSHTFKVNDTHSMLSHADDYEGSAQYYWYCSCSDCNEDNRYYIEYSVEWADHYGTDTFVLFRERDGNPGLDVNWSITQWWDQDYADSDKDSPSGTGGNDQAVAAFTVPYSVVNYSA